MRFGIHAVAEALRAGRVQRVFLEDASGHTPAGRLPARLASLADLARQSGARVTYVPADILTARAGTSRHQGAVAETRPFHYATLHDLLARGRDEPPFFLVLDGIEDPQNLGAILRSADAAGVHGVILPQRRAAAVTAAVGRASAGAVDHVPVARVVNLARSIEELKGAGLWIYGLDAEGDTVYDGVDYVRPLALIAGAEGKGLSRLVRERCDVLLRIPLYGHVASLNVSVATSLALFAARRQRGAER